MKAFYTIIFFLLSHFSFAQKANRLIEKGNEAYRSEQYHKAEELYKEALKLEPNNHAASFNLGNALFRRKKYSEAIAVLEELDQRSSDSAFRAKIRYNQGVMLTEQHELNQSIEAYKQSLRLNPADTFARENLQRALNEWHASHTDNQHVKQEEKKKDQKPKSQQLTKQQMEQMLKELEDQEKTSLEKMTRKPLSARQSEKNW